MAKTKKNKQILEFEEKKNQKQLKCWSRWVDARVLMRKLDKESPEYKELFELLEQYKIWYTLTEKQFDEIKLKYVPELFKK